MAKYNWKQLEQEYIIGDYKSVSVFLNEKGIPNNGSTRKQTSGWNDKKRQKQEEIKTKTIEKVIKETSNKVAQDIVGVNSVANKLLNKIDKLLVDVDMRNIKYVTSALKDIKDIIGDKTSQSSFADEIEKAWSKRNE